MNLNLIKEKLAALKGDSNRSSKLIWKPSKGTQVIRFLPYKFDIDFPFVELSFHYDITGTTVLSPECFGKPDPINEFANQLKRTGVKDDFLLSRKIESKKRWYAPILVRGEQEAEGVKFWGFSKTIYEELLKLAEDPDYGDFTNPKDGRDFTVEFIPADKEGAYPETKIRAKPATSKVTANPEVLSSIEGMPDPKSLFKTMEYDELKAKLEAFLDGTPDESNDTILDDDTDIVVPPEGHAIKKTTTQASTSLEDVDAAFTAMFS
jgi:hypothetical protein